MGKKLGRQIAQALLENLKHLREVKTDWSDLKVVVEYDGQGAVYCSLDGATYFESSLFRNSLQEILGPIGNPKYPIRTRGVKWTLKIRAKNMNKFKCSLYQ